MAAFALSECKLSRHVIIQLGGVGLVDKGLSRGAAIQLTAGPSEFDGSFVVPVFIDGYKPFIFCLERKIG